MKYNEELLHCCVLRTTCLIQTITLVYIDLLPSVRQIVKIYFPCSKYLSCKERTSLEGYQARSHNISMSRNCEVNFKNQARLSLEVKFKVREITRQCLQCGWISLRGTSRCDQTPTCWISTPVIAGNDLMAEWRPLA